MQQALWAVLFVVGVILMAVQANGGPAWLGRIAWILWAVAALQWLLGGPVLHSQPCTSRLFC